MADPQLQRLLQLEVPIVVQLGSRQMRVREIVALCPGAIIELSKQADEELDLLVNNKQIGTGSAVKVGENFGIQITFIGDVRERVEALGASAAAEAEDDEAAALAEALLAGQL